MKRSGFAVLVTAAALLTALSGCVSTGQIAQLEEQLSAAESGLARMEAELADQRAAGGIYVTREELSEQAARFASKDELAAVEQEVEGTLGTLVREAEKELEQMRGEVLAELNAVRRDAENILQSLATADDLARLSGKLEDLEYELILIEDIISSIVEYAGYADAGDYLEFFYGLVDMEQSVSEIQRRFARLSEAMRLFIE